MSRLRYDGNSRAMRARVQSFSNVPVSVSRNHSRSRPAHHRGDSGEASASRSFRGTKVPNLKRDSRAAMTRRSWRGDRRIGRRGRLRPKTEGQARVDGGAGTGEAGGGQKGQIGAKAEHRPPTKRNAKSPDQKVNKRTARSRGPVSQKNLLTRLQNTNRAPRQR